MSRLFAAFLLIVVLAIGGGAIATTAYQAGLTTAVAQVPAGSATVVTPIVVPAYAYGFHPGFGILGFLGTILFLFLVFGLIRAIFGLGRGRRHGWGPSGPGWGPGGWGPNGDGAGPSGAGGPGGSNPWQARAHQTFETWHSEAHADPAEPHGPAGDAPTPRTGGASPVDPA